MNKKNSSSSYNNESITSLKGADRVRMRPGVIFGSDGIDGCEHSVFEILSNSIDEAREGFGNVIEEYRLILTRKREGLTGNLFSASFTPEENIKITVAKTMNTASVLTVSEPVPHSILRNIWMHRLFVTALNTASILKKVKMWADLKKSLLLP